MPDSHHVRSHRGSRIGPPSTEGHSRAMLSEGIRGVSMFRSPGERERTCRSRFKRVLTQHTASSHMLHHYKTLTCGGKSIYT
jgi:hypothetical protein